MEIQGLTDREVSDRVSNGEVNSVEQVVSRTYIDIITKNVFTVFNLILFALGALLFYYEEVPSALAATGIITMNILIATVQEIRAKRRLDKIALLMRPKVAVLRNDCEKEIDQSEIVKDDVIHLRSGDQALVDGVLISVRSLELDESLLTGESRTIRKNENDTVYSGSYCITGEGYYKVTAFGDNTFAAKMLASAKRFDRKQSPLQMETGAVTKLMMIIALIYLFGMTVIKFATADTDLFVFDNILDIFAGTVGVENAKMAVIILDIVPIALFLMIVITYMIAAVRMSDSGILLQRSNAVESMSHVDTVCMDKTGTITTNKLVFKDIYAITEKGTAERYVRMFASSTGSRNRTIDALVAKYGETGTEVIDEIMFSSERKYAGVRLNDNGKELTLILGAYSVLSKNMGTHENIKEIVDGYSSEGLRTVVLAKGEGGFFVNDEAVLPGPLEPVAVIAIEDEVRPDCKSTIGDFIDNGIEIRILSGDDPAAVDALFRIAGLPGTRNILSGDELDVLEGDERKERIVGTNIFGRMRPEQKQTVIKELKDSGRYVAMVGDGVNDVRSLKEANVGIALQSGSGAARGVADMVLIGDNFSALPKALVEGNRTVSGMRDILKMYLARNFVIAILVFFIAVIFSAPPLVPITSAVYAFVGLSIAAFFMAVWARPSKIERTVLPDVLRYAMPAAVIISMFGFLLYGILHIGYTNGWIDWIGIHVDIPGNIESFGWGAYPSDAASQLTYEAEVVARNALLVFLILTGILQILFVVPRFGFFSVDGKVVKDAKPTVLMILLLGLVLLIYWAVGEYGASIHLSGKTVAEFFEIFLLPNGIYLIVCVFTAAWFFTARLMLRRGDFRVCERFAGWLYRRELRNAQKKRERQDQ